MLFWIFISWKTPQSDWIIIRNFDLMKTDKIIQSHDQKIIRPSSLISRNSTSWPWVMSVTGKTKKKLYAQNHTLWKYLFFHHKFYRFKLSIQFEFSKEDAKHRMNTNEKISTKKFNRCKLDRHRLLLQRPLLLPPLLLPVPPLPLGLPKTRENCNNFWNCNKISSQILILNFYFRETNERSYTPHWKRHFRAYQKLAKKERRLFSLKKSCLYLFFIFIVVFLFGRSDGLESLAGKEFHDDGCAKDLKTIQLYLNFKTYWLGLSVNIKIHV